MIPIFHLFAVALTALGYVLLGRVGRCRRSPQMTLSRPVSIIIPARNEEQNLPRLLNSIRSQKLDFIEILVIDDGSTDSTAAIAGDLGAIVLGAPPLQDGWRGKAAACWHGAHAATHATLLFLDADTWLEPDGLAAILNRFAGQPTALSVLPFHVVRKPYENISAFFQLVMAGASKAFTLPALPPTGLFGQMLLIDRDLYFRIGGHEAVHDQVLENLHLARLLRQQSIPFRCVAGEGMLSMRMYPQGVASLIEGWTKAFAAGAAQTPRAVLFIIMAWIVGLFCSAAVILADRAQSSIAVYLFAVVQIFLLLRRLGTFPFYVAVLYPIVLCAYVVLFVRALTRRRVTWKGRTF